MFVVVFIVVVVGGVFFFFFVFCFFVCFFFQLNIFNSSDTDILFTNAIISLQVYDKRYDFDFDIVIFLDGDIPSYGVYISKIIRFASLSSRVNDFNNTVLTAERLHKAIDIITTRTV